MRTQILGTMRLIPSNNEILSVVAKSLFAIGFPAGTDIDNAKNVIWLEYRGLDGIKNLAKELEMIVNLPAWPKPEYKKNGDTTKVWSDFQSGLILAQPINDLAQAGEFVVANDLRFPWMVLAEAGRRSKENKAQVFTLKTDSGLFQYLFIGNKIYFEKHLPSNQARVNIELIHQSRDFIFPDANFHIFETTKDRVWNDEDQEHWEFLIKLSKLSLVPSSALSRSGAGAEVDDNN